MELKKYVIIERAVEEGVGYGWRRAHKYVDPCPADEDISVDTIVREVMTTLDEVVKWSDEADD